MLRVLHCALALFSLSRQMFVICSIIIAHTERALTFEILCVYGFCVGVYVLCMLYVFLCVYICTYTYTKAHYFQFLVF